MTTKLEQAARQALEALLDSDDGGGLRYTEVQAVAALREALAEQAEQEPVGKIVLGQYEVPYIDWTSGVKVEDGMKIYAAPVRTKDLTDDEIHQALESCGLGASIVAACRAVIAADREKNK